MEELARIMSGNKEELSNSRAVGFYAIFAEAVVEYNDHIGATVIDRKKSQPTLRLGVGPRTATDMPQPVCAQHENLGGTIEQVP